MTPKQLATIAAALYGSSYVAPTAKLLGVTPRNLQYWAKGERLDAAGHIPAHHDQTLQAALVAHAAKLRKLARSI